MTTHRYKEVWVNLAGVERVQMHEGNGVLLRFEDHEHAEAFYEQMCSGRELVGGSIYHDNGRHCPVHPDH